MDTEKTSRLKIVQFLSAIPPVIDRGISVESILKESKLPSDCDVNTILTFLKFFHVVSTYIKNNRQYIVIPTQHAYYFIKSLKLYIENNLHLIESWDPMTKGGELFVDEFLNWGNQFLYAMERNREANLKSPEPLEEVHIILFIIKGIVGSKSEDKYLFRYNLKRLNLQLTGGYIKNNDTDNESAGLRILEEEIPFTKFTKSKVSFKSFFPAIVTYGTSFENGVFTKFNIYPYFVKFNMEDIKLDSTFQWLSLEEIEERESMWGIPIRFPTYEMDTQKKTKFIHDLKRLPLSLTNPQKEIIHKDFRVENNRYTKSLPKIFKLLEKDESEKLEFKSSARWDYIKETYNKDLEHVIIKTISAFLNTDGGNLVIGVADNKKILGIGNDLKSLKRRSTDGYTQFITNLIKEFLGVEYFSIIKIEYANVNKKIICIIEVMKSTKPVFYKTGKERDFYTRAGNTSRQLNPEEVYKYIQMHW